MPGALLRIALSTDMRMSCSLADKERQTQRFQVHPRSLGWRNRHEIQPQESPSLPTCLFSLLSDPGTHAGRFRGGPCVWAMVPRVEIKPISCRFGKINPMHQHNVPEPQDWAQSWALSTKIPHNLPYPWPPLKANCASSFTGENRRRKRMVALGS